MSIELLAPARNLETGLASVECCADVVYIGAPRFNTPKTAGNPLSDIEQLISYAQLYWGKVHVVVNTLPYDAKFPAALEWTALMLIIQNLGLL